MAKRIEYTEAQKKEFLELAQDVGIARAVRELGYPSMTMAKTWGKKYGVDLPLNALSQYANDMKKYYGTEEKLFTGQLILDRITERLSSIEDLAGDETKKLSEAYKNTLTAMNLVENKATTINESRTTDSFDSKFNALLEEQEIINRQKEMDSN